MATRTTPDRPASSTASEDLSDLNKRIADEATAACEQATSEALANVTTADTRAGE